MCGIAGVLMQDGGSAGIHEVEGMLKLLAHRGPDGEGTLRLGPVALGHRRLAVLDVGEGGHQPMSYAGGRYWMTLNGEIYNFLELKEELVGLGHSFRTESDTEVALAAYAQWGDGCQLRFNGMWAFAVWDVERRQLVLSRDRFGIKPLFYYSDGRRFAFASEMKAFLALPWFPGEFRLPAVAASLLSPSSLEATADCLLEGVSRLPAGHSLVAAAGGGATVSRWWSTLDHLERAPAGLSRQVEEFNDRFSDAVRLRMRSDISTACTLSGGLDSGSVASTMATQRRASSGTERQPADPPVAFVAAYRGTSHDESELAASVARHAGLEAVTIEVDPDRSVQLLDEFLFQCEEVQSPHMGPWLLYREMRRRGFKVSLDGHGGDELLAGYIDQVKFARDAALFPVPRPLRAVELTATLRRLRSEGAGSANVADWVEAGKKLRRVAAARLRRRSQANQGAALPLLRVAPLNPRPLQGDSLGDARLAPLTRRLYEDFHVRALPTILRDFDRFSMAHGVEVRSPFLDWRVVCYCLSLPARSVLGGGSTKRILREAMRGVLPEPVRTRTMKIPYKSPLAEWWSGPLREMALDTVNSRGFLASDVWDGGAVRRLVRGAAPGARFNDALMVFRFVVAHRLMELFRAARTTSGAEARGV